MQLTLLSGIFLLFASNGVANPLPPNSMNPSSVPNRFTNCPPGFSKPRQASWPFCYKMFADYKTEPEAANACKLNNGSLASVPDQLANSYLYWLATTEGVTEFWLGMQCPKGSTEPCKNQDGTNIKFSYFKTGQPDATLPNGRVYMLAVGYETSRWAIDFYGMKKNYACEAPTLSNGI